jgi:pimeloyl-ACP methyl ester carboxylesterase
MITLIAVSLGAALALVIGVAFLLAVTLPRRVARLVLQEQAKQVERALAVRASSAELAATVKAWRALLVEQVQVAGGLRSLVEWLAAYASARQAPEPAEVETLRKPDPAHLAAGLRPRPTAVPPASGARPAKREAAKTLASMTAINPASPRPAPRVDVLGEEVSE